MKATIGYMNMKAQHEYIVSITKNEMLTFQKYQRGSNRAWLQSGGWNFRQLQSSL